ncbi:MULTISPECIES: hypothetical protein [unclassified Streptomyces]|uniref:hypothetical protein n=1 Tax=unclassified Streptomyces TaxID=2593676 RepID=UPI002E0F4773|nr:hypothetical protein OG457_46905 [Streptomyces sp. NBC_01207]WTA16782.1 hypothetical protein OG365_01180 [Streptomyces sp. NBC_00853]
MAVRAVAPIGRRPALVGTLRYRTCAGSSLLQGREVEQAAAAATQSLELATRIGADRCVTLVQNLAPDFSEHRGVAGVGELMERLRVAA